MRKVRALIVMTLLAGAMIISAPINWPLRAQETPAVPKDQGAIPDAQIPSYILAAVNSPERSEADKALDAGRKPAQMLAFFGIKPGMHVADISAMGGWTTELLSLVVGPDGRVYSQNGHLPPKFDAVIQQWRSRSKSLPNVVDVVSKFDGDKLLPILPHSLDAVIINMSYHDLVAHGVNMSLLNHSIYKYLKPDGVYGIVDNSAKPGTGASGSATLHRIDEVFVINQVAMTGRAHFTLVNTSGVLRNSADDRSWPVFKHRGEQDRFMLKFVKPPSMFNQGIH
jgi:predicted methyltransferase